MFLNKKNYAFIVLFLTCASLSLIQCADLASKKKISKQEIVNSFAPGVVQIYTQHGIYDLQCPYKTPSASFGRGTGFFILYDNHYYIVTNHHVVRAAIALKVQLPIISQELMEVEIVSLYPEKDLALLSLTAKSHDKIVSSLGTITSLVLGDSDKAQKAQKTIALGYPVGGDTLKSTIGVISGHEFVNNQHMIQIDTPINPGNSGGPLFNDSGEVIGINTAGILEAQNIGYAIPINILKNNLAIMKEQFLIKKPYLGFLSINTGSTYAAMVGNPLPHGLYMAQIIKGSVFDSLGIQKGDMLYEIDGYVIDQYGDIVWNSNGGVDRMSIYSYVSRMIPNQAISLVYYRNGTRYETQCVINANEGPVATLYPPYQMFDYEIFGGLVITPLTTNHTNIPNSPFASLKKYQFLGKPRIIVSHVLKESELGLLKVADAGLLIKSINGVSVKTMDDVRNAIMISAQTGTWVVEFFSNQFNIGKFTIAFPLPDMLDEYQKLGKTNGYAPSQTIKDLRLLYNQSQKAAQ